MKTICKYELKITDLQEIEIPGEAQLLSVQVQNKTPYLWVLVYDTESEKQKIKLRTIGTGNEIVDYDFEATGFIGTYQLDILGNFVGHVFLVTESLDLEGVFKSYLDDKYNKP